MEPYKHLEKIIPKTFKEFLALIFGAVSIVIPVMNGLSLLTLIVSILFVSAALILALGPDYDNIELKLPMYVPGLPGKFNGGHFKLKKKKK
jgi:hypothetical protein